MTTATEQSVIRLYPYQQRFFADPARVLVACWCRQSGKDFTSAALAVDHALRTGQDWYIVSLTQRQADATFAKCVKVSDVFKRALEITGGIGQASAEYSEYDRWIDHWFSRRSHTLTLPGGGSVTALPGRDPDTLAGLTGNIIFTEFGLFPGGGYDHWRVVFPLATRGFRVVVISTPRGKNTKFFELVSAPETYSVHRVDIHQAVAEGMPLTGEGGRPITIEDLRRVYGDEVGWRREYELEFSGDLEALVKWGQLVAAGELGAGRPFDLLRIEAGAGWRAGAAAAGLADGGRPEMGWDVARRGHLSVLWINTADPAGLKRLRRLVVMHDTEFALQRTIIGEAMDARRDGVGMGDSTGLGMDSNETLAARYPGRWEGLDFSGKSKRELGSLLMTTYDDAGQAIPPTGGPAKFVATDVYALQREGEGANLKLAETGNPLDDRSHCDIAWACALALRAGQIRPAQPYISVA